MQFFILAGGYGTRLRPLSWVKPKPIFPFNGIPLINIILEQLKNAGFKSGYINTHYLPDQIHHAIASSLEIEFPHEIELGGSAVLNRIDATRFPYTLVINGDIFLDIPVDTLYRKIKDSTADVVLLTRPETEGNYSHLEIDGDRYQGIKDKSENGGIMYSGVALFRSAVLKKIRDRSFFQTFHKQDFDIRVEKYNGIWLDIGSPELYHRAVFEYLRHRGIENQANALSDYTFISPESTVSRSILWENVRIEGRSRVRNSILMPNVIIRDRQLSNKILTMTDNRLTEFDLSFKVSP